MASPEGQEMVTRRRNVQRLLGDPKAQLHTIVAAYENALTLAEVEAGRGAARSDRLDAIRERLGVDEADLPGAVAETHRTALDGEDARQRLCRLLDISPGASWDYVLRKAEKADATAPAETLRVIRARIGAPDGLDLPTVVTGMHKDASSGEESRDRLCQEFNLHPDTPWDEVLQAVVELRMRHHKLLLKETADLANDQPEGDPAKDEPTQRRIRKGRNVVGLEPVSRTHRKGKLVEYTGDGKAKVRVGDGETNVVELDVDSLILAEEDVRKPDDK